MDLGYEGRRVARRLVDPNHGAPGQPAIGRLRESDLGGAGRAEAGVLPDRVNVSVDGVDGELREKVARAHGLAGDTNGGDLLHVDRDGVRPGVAGVRRPDHRGGEGRALAALSL